MLLNKELSYRIVGAAMEVHRELGCGFLEAVYEDALCHEFILSSIPYQRQVEIPIYYKGVRMGKYFADLLVDGTIIVEIKAASGFAERHIAQALHYLAATDLRLAILINFGTQSLQTKRVIR